MVLRKTRRGPLAHDLHIGAVGRCPGPHTPAALLRSCPLGDGCVAPYEGRHLARVNEQAAWLSRRRRRWCRRGAMPVISFRPRGVERARGAAQVPMHIRAIGPTGMCAAQGGTISHANLRAGTRGRSCRSDAPHGRSHRPRQRTMVIHRHPAAAERHASIATGGDTRTLAYDRHPSAVNDQPSRDSSLPLRA